MGVSSIDRFINSGTKSTQPHGDTIGFVISPRHEMPSITEVVALLRHGIDTSDLVVGNLVKIIDRITKQVFIGLITNHLSYSDITGREEYFPHIAEKGPDYVYKDWLNSSQFIQRFIRIKLLAMISNGKVGAIDFAPITGSPVYPADKGVVDAVFGFRDDGIFLGRIYGTRYDVKIPVNSVIPQHGLIIGQTGSGKSYAAGVIVEEALLRGIPVLIFDHFGEYATLKEPSDEKDRLKEWGLLPRAFDIKILEPKKDIAVDLDMLLRMPELWDYLNMSDAMIHKLITLLNQLKKNAALSSLDIIINRLGCGKSETDRTTSALCWRLETLKKESEFRWGIWNVQDYVNKGKALIIDMRGLNDREAAIYVSYVLTVLLNARKANPSPIPPTMVLLEEAHNYVPREDTPATRKVRTIIREGRKYGLAIWLISQRPSYLHPDAVTISNTHLVFRLRGSDVDYVSEYMPLTKDEKDQIPMLPDGVAFISNPRLRLPLKIQIRPRLTKHGGTTIDFLK
ncbi:MAG: ATP-binding protein [Vulcanisaeta sp.]